MPALLDRLSNYGSTLLGRASGDPGTDQAGQTFRPQPDQYALAEAYYWNTVYEFLASGNRAFADIIKSSQGLYRLTSGIYNPFARAVDWYPGAIYPGQWSEDGLPLPGGDPCSVPFASDTPEEVRLAGMALLGWGNWETERRVYIRQLVILGDAFGEIHVDYDSGKCFPVLLHPRHVRDIEWSYQGNVTMYRIEDRRYDKQRKQSYTYGKIVDRETITTLLDGELHGYDDNPAVMPNPFGFVPAAWVQFRNHGGQHGGSLIDAVRAKLDRLNSSASSVHDLMSKISSQPVILKTGAATGGLENITIGQSTSWRANPNQGKAEATFIKGPVDLEIARLLEFPELASELALLQDLRNEIEADLPEATMDDKIRNNPQISGVALRMMFGDVSKRHNEASSNADGGLRKFIQMGMSIQGHLTRSGAFGFARDFSDTQKLFLPFDLNSYAKGDLGISFHPRPLFPDTPMERVQAALARETITTVQGMLESGYSLDDIYGVGQAPDILPGLLEQRQQSTTSTADLLGRALNRGAA